MKGYYIEKAKSFLRYHDFPGNDIPIMFIHGLGCAGSFDYPEVAAQEALKNHRRILVDLLGAGYSDKPDDFTYTADDHAEYLAEFVRILYPFWSQFRWSGGNFFSY
jgi:haloalkane dehalogenase